MAKKNPHIGSSFDSWLDKEGIRKEATSAAIKALRAHQLANKKKKEKSIRRPQGGLAKRNPPFFNNAAQCTLLLRPTRFAQWKCLRGGR